MILDQLRSRLRAFLTSNIVPENKAHQEHSEIEAARAYQRALFDAALAGLTWPAAYGGQDLPSDADLIFDEETQHVELPTSPLTLALKVCGPAVLQFGTRTQKEHHLAATLRGEQVWCQLWSEPEAGSDLANVRTSATFTDEGSWIVNGHKIWTSHARDADYAILLCRTDPAAAKHRGLSVFIVDMRLPGITVRPLKQMTAQSEFNEVFLDNVTIRPGSLLGEAGQGWPITTWMMGRERISVGLGMRNAQTLSWSDVRAIARQAYRDSDPAVRQHLTELYVQEHAAQLLGMRLRQEAQSGRGTPLLGSAVKIAEAALIHETAELALQLLAESATAWDHCSPGARRVADALLMSPAFAIGGGTDDIQLNTLGEHFLGLPRDRRD
jgi:alkylation response protein AidB-like acyl-CoA dehydrogenase